MSESVRLHTTVAERRSEVYAALVDYRALTSLVDGLVSLEPGRSRGSGDPAGAPAEGDEFAAVMRIGGSDVRSRLVLTRLQPEERVVWTSRDDDDRELSFTLADGNTPDQTRILLVVTYELPPGIKGVLVRPIVEQAVKGHARGTLLKLKERFGAA